MKSKQKNFDFFIAGGGLAGLLMALSLQRNTPHLKIAIADQNFSRNKLPPPSSRTSALMEESLNFLKSIGLYESLKKTSEDLKTLSIIDISLPQAKPVQQNFYASELHQDRFGRNIINTDLYTAALNLIKKNKNIFCIPSSLENYEAHEQAVTIHLQNGTKYSAKLLIGADGRSSKTRTCAGIETWVNPYNQIAITGIVSHKLPHKNCSTEFHKDGGPLTLVPLPHHHSSFVWMEETNTAEKLLRLSQTEFEKKLEESAQHILGKFNLKTPLESWPIQTLYAKKLYGPRMALIAEAAHVLSPIGAQGLNLSIRDIDALTKTISRAEKLGLDYGSVIILKAYAKARSADILLRVGGTDILNKAVLKMPPFLKPLRRMALNLAGEVTPLRRALMREGLRGYNT